SAVRTNNAVTNAEAESRTLRRLLRRIKRIENPLRIRHTSTVIRDRDFNVRSLLRCANRNPPALPDFLHRVVRVIQNVQEHLLQLLPVSKRMRQILVKLFEYLDAMARKVIAPQLDRLSQHRVDMHQFALYRPLSRKTQQILNDILRPLRLMQNNLQILAG